MYETHFSVYRDSKLKKVVHGVLRTFRIFLLILLLLGGSVFLFLVYRFGPIIRGYYESAVKQVSESSVGDFSNAQTSYIYASDGTQIAKLTQDKDVSYVKYSDLPDGVLKAFVAIEDKRFWEHDGVDWLSTAKAAFLLVKDHGEITRGGSTITQQLARNVYLSFEQSYERKFREIFLALELEKKYSKESILEFYVNNINFANGYYGIGAAAKGYFDKSVAELTDEEIAFLCAIPNNPTYYNPRTNFEHTISRRNLILKEMKSQGYLDEDEFLKAINSPVKLVDNTNDFYNYEGSYAIDCAVKVLMERAGFEFRYSFENMTDYKAYKSSYDTAYDEAKIELYTGGYCVETSIDLRAQQTLQSIVDETLSGESGCDSNGLLECQGAATVIDNSSGLVVAIVGGRSQESGVRTLNRAYQSYRQPGSTIKPLIVYTPALEREYTPDSIVEDTPIEDGPKNSNSRYDGAITLRSAVEQSKNVVAWRLLDEIKPANGLSYVQKMSFAKIVPDDYYDSAALGGLTYGVSTVEMASGYATLANSGIFRKATCITRMLDSNGKNILTGAGAVRVYAEESAKAMTDILMGVAANGTARGLSLSNGMPIACKTGTTNGQTVGWFCGYTPYYSMAVYVGADTNVSINGLWGSTYPMEIWQRMQEYLCGGKPVIDLVHGGVAQPSEPVDDGTVEPSEPTESEPVENKPEKSKGNDSDSGVPSLPEVSREPSVLPDSGDSQTGQEIIPDAPSIPSDTESGEEEGIDDSGESKEDDSEEQEDDSEEQEEGPLEPNNDSNEFLVTG